MAKITDEQAKETFAPYLNGEELTHWAYGIKQPNLILIVGLFALAIVPGAIAMALLSKNYLIGWTGNRFIVLQIGTKLTDVKQVTEYDREQLSSMKATSSSGALFTHIKIKDAEKPFVAKFHRAFSKTNRPNAMAIGEALVTLSA